MSEIANDLKMRKERRAERREKQRRVNLLRAEKMHELRVANDARRAPFEQDCGFKNAIQIGCSGWYYWHWKGSFYPTDLPRKDWFSIYQNEFHTVELNAPFYTWPSLPIVKSWLRRAEADFIYTVKVSELITHIQRFEDTGELIKDFGYIADVLGPQMGCFLFQLPPSIHYSPEMLRLVLSQLDPRRRNVVEFRHKSWWNDDTFSEFSAANAIFCSCSGPRLPDTLVKTADDVYIRFHGTTQWYRHDYSQAELSTWVDRIRQSGARTVWAYFNNDRDANAITNAKMLVRLLGLS